MRRSGLADLLRLPLRASLFDVAVLVIVSYFVLFLDLGRGAIRQWDESSLAVNALEMSLSGHWMVKSMDGRPDLINTKPPLLIWTIVGFMRLLGYNEIALRLPSALSALFTVFIVYFYTLGVSRRRIVALLAGFVLLTSIGFTGEHVARTGDYDAMLVLWITLYALSYFKYLEDVDGRRRDTYLALATCGVILAVMTKGVAGILALPGLMLYTVWRKQLVRLLSIPAVYVAALAWIIVIGGYYGLRETLGPGYLQAIVRNELTGRLLEVVPGGTERDSLYYVQALWSYRFTPWFYMLPVCWLLACRSREEEVRRFGVFSVTYVCCYLVIISASKTKFRWYDAPVYPVAAGVIGMGVAIVLESLANYVSTTLRDRLRFAGDRALGLVRGALTSAAILLLCGYPYFRNAYYEVHKDGVPFRENEKAVTDTAQQYKTYYTQLAASNLALGTGPLKVINSHRYNLPLLFYTQVAGIDGRYALRVEWEQPSTGTFSDGDVLVNCDSLIGASLKERYIVRMLHRYGSCETLLVAEMKDRG
jgi:4-amino-4-deoxy-L-arabinose transferase-like glycosyltransferase